MIILVLFIQVVSIIFFFKIIIESDIESYRYYWYSVAVLHFLFILRFIYVETHFSYSWYDHIMEFISLAIALLIVIPTSIYYLIRRSRKEKKK